jgi:hypothetical protein
LIHKNHDEFEHLESILNGKEPIIMKNKVLNSEGPDNDTYASRDLDGEMPKDDQPLIENKVRT